MTDTYISRKEASPLENIRTKFVEQPFKLRNDIYNNFGKAGEIHEKNMQHTRARSSIYDSIKSAAAMRNKSIDHNSEGGQNP